MADQVFVKRSRIAASPEEVFRWHAQPGAFERLVPPWERVTLLRRSGGIETGGRVEMLVPMGPFRKKWVAEHREYEPGRLFRDVSLEGPFAKWEHTHLMEPDGAAGCWLEDRIVYALPGGWVGAAVGSGWVRRQLEQMFAYRHQVTAADITAHHTAQGAQPMNVLISGATGLVGKALMPFLTTGGHQTIPLVRKPPATGTPGVFWDPAAGVLNPANLAGIDAVVHLAGENVAGGRWTAERKEKIRSSRAQGTRLLAETLAKLPQKPAVLVSASAIGFYGNRGEEELIESSAAGTGFLAEVCQEWEAATEPARAAGIRVVCLRFGVVLSPGGGALAKMLTPFKMGVGGPLGTGKQYMSWLALDDALGMIHHALTQTTLAGPVNAVSPRPVTNAEFTKTLGRVLSRPAFLPMPAFAARLAFGEMGDALLLSGAKVLPRRLQETGYTFRFNTLEDALRHLLGRQPVSAPAAHAASGK